MTHAGSLLAGTGWPGHWAVLSGTFSRPVSRELACVRRRRMCSRDTAWQGRAPVPPLICRVYPYPEGLMRSDRPVWGMRGGLCTPPLINAVPGGVLRGEA